MDNEILQEYFELLREESLPAQWSRAVKLSRHLKVIRESLASEEDIALRVFDGTAPGGFYVVHTIEDGLWQCDCSSKEDPCVHVLATAIILKTGRDIDTVDDDTGIPQLHYEMIASEGLLCIRRFIQCGEERSPCTESLKTLLGGVQSGRLQRSLPRCINEDFVLDELLSLKGGSIAIERVDDYLKLLSKVHHVFWNAKEIRVDLQPYTPSVALYPDNKGVIVKQYEDPLIEAQFKNQLIIYDGTLRRCLPLQVHSDFKDYVSRAGKRVERAAIESFTADIFPQIEKHCAVVEGKELLPELRDVEPRIVLDVTQVGDHVQVLARLWYGDPPLAEIQDDTMIPMQDDVVPRRKHAVERLLERELRAKLHLSFGRIRRFTGDDAYQFLKRSEGWDRTDSNNQFQEVQPLIPQLMYADGRLEVQFLTSENQKTDISFSMIQESIRNGQQVYGSGSNNWFALPHDWFHEHGVFIERMLDLQGNDTLPVSCMPAVLAYSSSHDTSVAPSLEAFAPLLEGKLVSELPLTYLLERGVQATLRPYQERGVSWLKARKDCGAGAILADDMGLGKTLQSLCVFDGCILIVCPMSVLSSWEEQVKRFRPDYPVYRYHGPSRSLSDDQTCIVLTTYALLWRDEAILCEKQWDVVVLDESQHIKNPDSNTAQAAHKLKADFRIALSGTPIENSLEDLWSQFEFIAPGLLGSRSWFQSYCSQSDVSRLRFLIHPFILRRNKAEVAADLPEKIESTLWCDFHDDEQERYDEILLRARVAMNEEGASMSSILEYLLRLRQACCHPELLGESSDKDSSKLEVLYESLEQSKVNGHKMLVFSQWTSFLDIVESGIKDRGFRYNRLDGSTKDRQGEIQSFQENEEVDLMLLSLKAGGTGITLTAADHVYLLDPWWNPAVEQQAADRAHRIGQTNTVFVYRLAMRNSVEEKILKLQEKKRELSSSMLEGSQEKLTKEELSALFDIF